MEGVKGWLAEFGGHFPSTCPPLCRYNACLGSFADVYGDLPSAPAPDIRSKYSVRTCRMHSLVRQLACNDK